MSTTRDSRDAYCWWSTIVWAVVLVVLVGWAEPTAAEEPVETIVCPICQHADQKNIDYAGKAGSTLARGAANTLFGWTEIIRQPAEEAKHGRNVRNVLTGVANGVGEGVKRTAAGVGELLTFWTPKINEDYVKFAHDCPICMGKQKSPPPE